MNMKTNQRKLQLRSVTVLLLLTLVLGAFMKNQVVAQDIQNIDPELTKNPLNSAEVKVDGRLLFYVSGISSFKAPHRAEIISKRISEAAADQAVNSDSVKLVPGTDRISIYAGEHFIVNVFDIDANAEGISRIVLAEMMQKKIAAAIDDHRHDRSQPVLIRKLIWAAGAAVLLVALVWLVFWLMRWLNVWLQNRIKSRIDTVENISYNLIRSNQLWKAINVLFKTLRVAIIVIIVAIFLQYILGLFPWTNNVAAYTLDLFLDPIIKIGRGLLGFLPSLAFLIVIFLFTRYLLKLTKLFFTGIDQGGIKLQNFDTDWAMPTYRILRVFVIAFAVIIAYPYIPGSETSAFKGVSVFLGVLFSLGSSSFISNIIAGYSMTYRGAFKKGDRIKVDDQVGFVEEQKLLVTRLRSVKNEEVVIPNSVLLNSNITNYSARAKDIGLILHTTVGIGYETPWRQVEAMLKIAAARTEGLLKDPPPYVLQQSLGDFAVNYEINAYCCDVTKMHLYYTALHQNILDIFNENNVQIMTPAYEGDPEIPKVVPKDQWNTPLAG